MSNDVVHSTKPTETTRSPQFKKVKDSRGHKVRGLWKRGARFYSQMTVYDNGEPKTKRVPLKAGTVPDAMKERNALVLARDQGTLKVERNVPITFAAVADEYAEFIASRKASSTVRSERSAVTALKNVFGSAFVRHISESQVQDFVSARLADGMSPGSINRLRYVLNNAMAYAKSRGYISRAPDWDVDWLDYSPKTRRLVSAQDIDAFCAAARACERPQAFLDYIRLMAYCGGRKAECLKLLWTDVLWGTQQLRFRGTTTKNGQTRHVNFNPELEALLKDMNTRRLPDSDFMFPSPWESREQARSDFWHDFTETQKSMKNCPIPDFHTLRHFFISTAVMAGIDYMTISAWVGHQDGGVLIGRVYGHLNDSHKQSMASKLTFK